MTAATILFAGTPDFARASLCALVDTGHKPAVVLTQPDRPAGRGKKMTASAVKQYAATKAIDVWQPASLRDAEVVAAIAELQPDLMVVAAYGLILPQTVLDIPVHGCVNVHASLLPRWRGAAPIQHAILNGDAHSGVCLMQMEAGLDTGPVYARSATSIGADETAGELHDRLAIMGGELLANCIEDLLQGKLEVDLQNDSEATYAAKIKKGDAAIDWHTAATDVIRAVRAYNPVPGAFFELHGERIKCWHAEVLPDLGGSAGQILRADKAGIDVACATGAVRLLEVQRPGRKRVTGAEFATQEPAKLTALTDARL